MQSAHASSVKAKTAALSSSHEFILFPADALGGKPAASRQPCGRKLRRSGIRMPTSSFELVARTGGVISTALSSEHDFDTPQPIRDAVQGSRQADLSETHYTSNPSACWICARRSAAMPRAISRPTTAPTTRCTVTVGVSEGCWISPCVRCSIPARRSLYHQPCYVSLRAVG